MATFSSTANPWVIFDTYQKYERVKEALDVTDDIRSSPFGGMTNLNPKADEIKIDQINNAEERLLRSAKILERIVVQEIYKELAFG